MLFYTFISIYNSDILRYTSHRSFGGKVQIMLLVDDENLKLPSTKEFVLSLRTREQAATITTPSTTVYINLNLDSIYIRIRPLR